MLHSPEFPGTSVSEIASYGVPQSKLVVGKVTRAVDAGNGFMSAFALGACFALQASSNSVTPWQVCMMEMAETGYISLDIIRQGALWCILA